jgi:hypothetical protein
MEIICIASIIASHVVSLKMRIPGITPLESTTVNQSYATG